jgi:membrane protein EpsK
MSDQSIGERMQVRTNSLASLGYFVFNAVIGLWLVPYLIGKIGVDGYGIIVLAVSLTAYIGLAAGSVNSSISRFLSVDINRNDLESANRTFNSAIIGVAAAIGLLLPVLWALSANIVDIFDVSPRFIKGAPILFLLLIISFFITFVRNIFTAPVFANNRLDLIFYCQGLELVTRVGVLVVCMQLLTPDVSQMGYANLVGAVLALTYGLYLWRVFAPYLTLSWRKAQLKRFSELVSMSGWITVNQTGAILFLNVDLIIANIFLGANAAGYYGALLQLSIALRSLTGLLSGVVTPLIFSRYAKGQSQELVAVAHKGVKFLGLFVAFPVGFVCAMGTPLLTLWLGAEFTKFVPLLWVMLFHLAVNVPCRPLFAVQQAANSVRQPALVTLTLGVVHVLLSILLVTRFDLGLYGIAVSGVITLTLKNSVYTVVHAAILQDIPLLTFIRPLLLSLIAAIFAAVFGTGLTRIIAIDSWMSLLAVAAITGVVYVGFSWRVLLGSEERTFLRQSFLGHS